MKEAIIKYGAVTLCYCACGGKYPYYNNMTFAYYGAEKTIETNETREANHVVTVVGWDDNYSRDNFIIDPGKDGAWIIQNTWGANFGDKGYFYLSYWDPSIFFSEGEFDPILLSAFAFSFENTIDYSINYQTDFSILQRFYKDCPYYSNEYTAVANELIGAVGTYFNDKGVDYEFEVYINGNLRHTQTGVSDFAGFKTIPLNKYIPVKANDKIKVVFKSNSVPLIFLTRQHYLPNMSMISSDGVEWKDCLDLNMTVSLKVYTVRDDSKIINNNDISVDYDGGSYFMVQVVSADGHIVGAGEVIEFTIDGKTTAVKTDDCGMAKIRIANVPKKYTMVTSLNGKEYKNRVVVKQVLKATKLSVKKTAKKFSLKASLKINGKLQKGKLIIFKFNGKNYKVKTNKRGIAQKTFNKNVIKKLKKGKKYIIKVTYLKDTIKTFVKIK